MFSNLPKVTQLVSSRGRNQIQADPRVCTLNHCTTSPLQRGLQAFGSAGAKALHISGGQLPPQPWLC